MIPIVCFSISSINQSQDTVPYVNMVIRDKGLRLDTSALVYPGSLLDLLIYLDKQSSGKVDCFSLLPYLISDNAICIDAYISFFGRYLRYRKCIYVDDISRA